MQEELKDIGIEELQAAFDRYALKKAIGSGAYFIIIIGLFFAIIWTLILVTGSYTGPCPKSWRLFLALGLVGIAHGICKLVGGSRSLFIIGSIVFGVSILAVAGWSIFISIRDHNFGEGAGGLLFLMFWAFYQASSDLKIYGEFINDPRPTPSPEAMEWVIQLIRELRAVKTGPDKRSINFLNIHSAPVKCILLDDRAVFDKAEIFHQKYLVLAKSEIDIVKDEERIEDLQPEAPRGTFLKTPREQTPHGASFTMGDMKFEGQISDLSWDRYLEWKGGNA